MALSSERFTGGDLNVGGSEQVGVKTVCAGILSSTVTSIELGGKRDRADRPAPGDAVTARVLYEGGKPDCLALVF